MIFKEVKGAGKIALVSRVKLVDGYNYYISRLTMLYGVWMVDNSYLQPEGITSKKAAIEAAKLAVN